MKKLTALALIGLAITAHNAFGQTNTMLNVRNYSNLFLNVYKILDDKYPFASTDEDYDRIAALGGAARGA